MEPHLPNLAVELRPHLVRKATLYALRTALNCLALRRSQQNMQVFRHHNEPMQLVSPLIPIVKQSLDQQLSICRSNEE
jgi:hypothetical protein